MVHTEGQWTPKQLIAAGYPADYYTLSVEDQRRIAVQVEYRQQQLSEDRIAQQPRKALDGAQYTRQQKGHSLLLHLTLGVVVLWIPAIYYTVSPNHYWHA